MRKFQHGFETGDLTGSGWASASGSPTHSTTTVRTGTYSLYCASGAARYVTTSTLLNTGDAFESVYFRAYIYLTGSPTAEVIILGDSAAYLKLTTNRFLKIAALNGSSVEVGYGTGSHAIPLNTWTRIELCFNRPTGNASTTDGVLTARVDGVDDVSNSAVLTFRSSIWMSVGPQADAGVDMYFDDPALNDDTGLVNNSWCDAGAILNIVPNADWGPNDWSVTGAVLHADALSEGVPDTTTYISTVSKTSGLEDRWSLSNTPAGVLTTHAIRSVLFGVRGGGTATQSRTAKLTWSNAATTLEIDGSDVDWNLNGYKTVYPISTQQGAYGYLVEQAATLVLGTGVGGDPVSIAESFVAAGPVYWGVALYLAKTGTPTDNLVVELVASLSDTTPLASGSIAGGSLTTTVTLTDVLFSAAAQVTAGTTYYLRLRRDGSASAANYFVVGRSSVNYSNVEILTSDSSYTSGFVNPGSYDLSGVFYGFGNKAAIDGLQAAAVETNTNSNEIRWTKVWASYEFYLPAQPLTVSVRELVAQQGHFAGAG